MGAHRPKAPTTEHAFAAVLSLDPAAVADCGIALRFTAGLDGKTPRGKMRAPEFMFEGSVWSTRMHDELAVLLAEKVPRGGKVLLTCEDAMFGARSTARHLGRAIGCIEGMLADLNVWEPDTTRYVFPGHWRKFSIPVSPAPSGRDEWKQAAIDQVATLYGMACADNQAEAVLQNDYVMHVRQDWWSGKKGKRSAK